MANQTFMKYFCQECGEDFSDRRAALGYKICLECGQTEAEESIRLKSKKVAPAFNKGAYQYLPDTDLAPGKSQ